MADNIGAVFSVEFESLNSVIRKLDILTKQINSNSSSKVKLDIDIEEIKKAVQEVNNLKKQNIQVLGNGQIKTVSEFNDNLNRTVKIVDNLTTGKKSISITNNTEKTSSDLIKQGTYLDNIITRLKTYQQALNANKGNSTSHKQLNSEIQTQIIGYEKLRNANKLLSAEEKARINSTMNQTKLQTSQLTNFQNGLSGILKRTASYALGGSAVYAGINELRKGITAIKEVDDAMRDLKRVSDDVAGSILTNFTDVANGMAIKLGQTTEGVIQATAMFKQLGYSFKESSEYMASNAMILSNVGDMSATDSANAIVSTLKGFKLEAKDTTDVVDVLNETGNKFAITTGQLAEGLRIGSASLAIANNSLAESTALITTGTEVLRDSDKVSNGLKTISMRLRGIADEEGNLEPKMRELVQSISGKDIMDGNDNFKSTYEILKDLGSVWDTLSDKQRAYLAETVAGKNRANVFASIMQNSEQLEKVFDSATNSAGSATKEQEAYMNSISGKLNALKENFKGVFLDTIDSGALKGVIDIASGGIGVFRELGDTFGALPVLIGTVMVSLNLFSTKFKESFMGQMPILKQMNTFFDTLKTSIGTNTVATTANTTAKTVNNAVTSTGVTTKAGETVVTTVNTGAKVANTTATIAGAFATGAMTIAISALQAVMTFGLSLAVTALIGGIVKLADSLITTKAELKDFNEEISQTTTETQKSITSAEEYIKKIEQINKALGNTDSETEKTKLTEELTQAQKDLASALPEATTDIIDGTNIATSIDLTKEIIQLKKDEMKIDAQKFFSENKGLLADIQTLDRKKSKLKEYQIALAQGKTSISETQEIKDPTTGIVSKQNFNIPISTKEVEKLNDEILTTTETASKARVMAKYLGEDATEATKKTMGAVNDYTKSLETNTQEKDKNGKVITDSNSANNINVLSATLKELNGTGNLSEQAITRLANTLPKLDLSNMTAEEKVKALTKALEEQQGVMDTNSDSLQKQGQKDFVSQGEDIEKINGYLKTMGDDGQMSLAIMKELATSDTFADFAGDITDMTQVQEYFNAKLGNMKAIQGDAYSTMMGNSEAYYQSQLDKGNGLQNSFNSLASDFVDVNGEGYTFDAKNFNTLNEAKAGMVQALARPIAEWISNMTGQNAEGYEKDLRNFTTLAEQKVGVLKILDAQIAKINSNMAIGVSEAKRINNFQNLGLSSSLDNSMENLVNKHQTDLQAQLDKLNSARQEVTGGFDQFAQGFSGYTPTGMGSSYTDGSSGSAEKAKEDVANLESLVDRYYRLDNVISALTNTIDKYENAKENAHGKEYVDAINNEIEAYKNKQKAIKSNIDELAKERWEKRVQLANAGFDFDGDWNINGNYASKLEQLTNSANALSGDAKENAINAVKELSDATKRYAELVFNEIPSAEKEWQELSDTIQETYKSMAEEIASKEQEISEVVSYYAEKNVKTKQDALDRQIEAVNKAYDDEDKSVSLNNKKTELAELKSEMDKFEFATDKMGINKFKSLQEQYKTLEDEMNQTIRDTQKETTLDNLNKEKDALGTALEDYLKPENINGIIESGLKTGMVNVMGQIMSLSTANASMLKETEVGYTNVASQTKIWADSLSSIIAMYPQLNAITSTLGYNVDRTVPSTLTNASANITNLVNTPSGAISISIPLTVMGNITEDVMPNVKKLIDDATSTLKVQLSNALRNR